MQGFVLEAFGEAQGQIRWRFARLKETKDPPAVKKSKSIQPKSERHHGQRKEICLYIHTWYVFEGCF